MIGDLINSICAGRRCDKVFPIRSLAAVRSNYSSCQRRSFCQQFTCSCPSPPNDIRWLFIKNEYVNTAFRINWFFRFWPHWNFLFFDQPMQKRIQLVFLAVMAFLRMALPQESLHPQWHPSHHRHRRTCSLLITAFLVVVSLKVTSWVLIIVLYLLY
jgi:hypothetical protein